MVTPVLSHSPGDDGSIARLAQLTTEVIIVTNRTFTCRCSAVVTSVPTRNTSPWGDFRPTGLGQRRKRTQEVNGQARTTDIWFA